MCVPGSSSKQYTPVAGVEGVWVWEGLVMVMVVAQTSHDSGGDGADGGDGCDSCDGCVGGGQCWL